MALIIKEDTLKRHKQAMFFAQDAFVARQMGDEIMAVNNFNNALELELEVLKELKSGDTHVETLGVIIRSAASIAFNGYNFSKAQSIIKTNRYDFPDNVQLELDELLIDIETQIQANDGLRLLNYIVIVDYHASVRAVLYQTLYPSVKFIMFDSLDKAIKYLKDDNLPCLFLIGSEENINQYETLNTFFSHIYSVSRNYKSRVIAFGNLDQSIIDNINGRHISNYLKMPFDPVHLIDLIKDTKLSLKPEKEFKLKSKDFSINKLDHNGKNILKRVLDILVSSFALFLLSPLLLLIFLIIKIESRGPAFYYSLRTGKNYKLFRFYKFRTMIVDADKKVKDDFKISKYNRKNHAVFTKIANDPRITRFGGFLRNTSLDELPQLVNVLVGDMSLVGNRPLPLYEAATLTSYEWIERFTADAGITGLWQIAKRGKASMSIQERIDLDIKYSKSHNLALDMWILMNTPKSMIQKSNV